MISLCSFAAADVTFAAPWAPCWGLPWTPARRLAPSTRWRCCCYWAACSSRCRLQTSVESRTTVNKERWVTYRLFVIETRAFSWTFYFLSSISYFFSPQFLLLLPFSTFFADFLLFPINVLLFDTDFFSTFSPIFFLYFFSPIFYFFPIDFYFLAFLGRSCQVWQ